MSNEATAWVISLPHNAFPTAPDALRWTLWHMADVAGVDKGHMFYMSRAKLAERRGVSEETIKRHLKLLADAGLIERGDQSIVMAFPLNARPNVWHLPVGKRFGGASVTPRPVDKSPAEGAPVTPRGGTDDPSNKDLGGSSVTRWGGHVRPPNQELNYQENSPTQVSTDAPWEFSTGYEGAPFTDSPNDRAHGDCIHGDSLGIHALKDGSGVEPWCPLCRRARRIVPAVLEVAS